MNNKVLQVNAYAKVNLTLDILGKREDGFHEVSMIMQRIGLCDTIIMEITNDGGIILTGDVPGVVKSEDNLIYKAAQLLGEYCNIDLNCKIELVKRIPVAAGLAGGSADAGTVLLGLNKLLELNCSKEELLALGAKLGSDIPFTMLGGTMLATGRGEILTPCVSNLKAGIVLVKPTVSISTPWAYGQYAKYADILVKPDEESMKKALKTGNLADVKEALTNVFEQIMLKEIEEIALIKDEFSKLGYNSMMSGSGPTVFALVEDKEEAEVLAGKLKTRMPQWEIIASELIND